MNELVSKLGGSSLWLSLLGLIAVALFVVMAFNLLQSMQRRRRDAALRADETEAQAPAADAGSVQAGRVVAKVEPSLQPASRSAPVSAQPDATGDRIEPSFSRAPVAQTVSAPAAPSAPSTASAQGPAPVMSPAQASASGATGTLIERMGALRETVSPPDSLAEAARPAALATPAAPSHNAAPATPLSSTAQRQPTDRPSTPADLTASASAGQRAPAVSGRLDPHIDCIVHIRLPAPVAAERLVASAAGLRRAGSKPVLVETDGGAAGWLGLRDARGPIDRLRVGLLLANRHGPLNATEFSEFAEAVKLFSQSVNALEPPLPDMAPVLEHARQVDEFCAQLDTMIGVNVQAPTPISEAALAELADGLGLAPQLGQRYVRLSEHNEVLYSMSAGDRAEQITFLLDVPRAPQARQPWADMVECARRCASATEGVLVDDAQHPLTDAAVAAVARQLESHYKALEAAGLAAGSPAAVRVFN